MSQDSKNRKSKLYINFYDSQPKLRISKSKKWQYLFLIRFKKVSDGADII